MVTINFIPIDYDYFDYKGKNYAKIFGRDDKGKRICLIDSCDVFFWAILKDKISEKKAEELCERIEKIKVKSAGRETRVLKTEVHHKKFLGRDVKAIKIFIDNYKDAHDIADKLNFHEIDKRREYDLSYITKYILEKKLRPLTWYSIEGDIIVADDFAGINNIEVEIALKVEKISELENQPIFKPKILAYDIETDEFEIGKGQLLMISLVGENFKKVLTWKKNSSKDHIIHCKDETDMIEKFVKEVKKYDPDILTGYFSDGFDLPYLRTRAEKNNMKLNLGLDNSQPVFTRGRILTGKIKGIVHIDLFRFVKVVYSQYLQSETLSLNEVASELLGERKIEWDFKHSSKIHEHEWEHYYEYNLQDSILTYKLMGKLWPDFLEFTKVIQEPLFNISRDSMSSQVENYIIHHIEKFNEIIEKRPHYDEIGERREEEKYEGAFVFQPIPGLYENVVFFDFTSMYGSVIVSYNLSKSTYLEKKEKERISKSSKDDLSYIEVDITEKKVYFSKKIGFFSQMLSEIIEKRKEYKKELNKNPNPIIKARSNAFKLLTNAAYGYQGFFGARYYCREAAAATAALARKSIKETIELIKKHGFKIVYSDTDSIALLKGKSSKQEVLEVLDKIFQESWN